MIPAIAKPVLFNFKGADIIAGLQRVVATLEKQVKDGKDFDERQRELFSKMEPPPGVARQFPFPSGGMEMWTREFRSIAVFRFVMERLDKEQVYELNLYEAQSFGLVPGAEPQGPQAIGLGLLVGAA